LKYLKDKHVKLCSKHLETYPKYSNSYVFNGEILFEELKIIESI